jgi:lipopolysaccharide exporter
LLSRNWSRLFLPSGETLGIRAIRGGVWIVAAQAVSRMFAFVRMVVLARLIAPDDFGMFGIAMLTLSVTESLSETGFQAALVQKNQDTHLYLQTAWTLQVLRGVLLAAILYIAAPYVAIFFGEPAVISLVRSLSLAVLFRGFTNIGVIYFQKELEFRKQVVYQLSGTLVDVAVAVTSALLLRNAWALVYGLLAGIFIQVAMSYVLHPYRPSFRLDVSRAKELLQFGKWMFLLSVLVFFINQGDDAFLGKVLGATELGLYQIAFRIGMLPATVFTLAISQISFPVYAKLQAEPYRLRMAFCRTLEVTALVVFPITAALIALGDDLTHFFLGPQWVPMVPLLQILALKGLIWALAGITGGPLYMAMGRPDINLKLNLAQAAVMLLLIYPFYVCWGAKGIAGSVVIAMAANYGLNVRRSLKITGLTASEYLAAICHPLCGSALAGALGLAVGQMMQGSRSIPLMFTVLLMVSIYITWLKLAGKLSLLLEIANMLKGLKTPRKNNKESNYVFRG